LGGFCVILYVGQLRPAGLHFRRKCLKIVNDEVPMSVPSAWVGYFSNRWRGNVNASKLLLWDMLAIGTALNVVTSFLALLLLAKGATYSAIFFHFALLPYNLFLVLSLWRSSEKSRTTKIIAVIWFAITIMI